MALTAGAENGSSDANNGSGNVTQNVAEVHGWQQQVGGGRVEERGARLKSSIVLLLIVVVA